MFNDDSPPPNIVLDIEVMIDEIKIRPVLWDRFSVEYNDRVQKNRSWEAVNEAVFDDWQDLGSAEKRIRAEEIKKKWRNLRDTYAKELVTLKKARRGKIKQKRPYRYKENLSFLEPQFVEKVAKKSSTESSEEEDDNRRRKFATNNVSENLIIDVKTLIREVKSRPILWNRQSQLSDQNEREMREKLWDEICEVIFDNWSEIGSSGKSLRSVEVKKKWRNLRDSYGRELGTQRKIELGIIKPKKPYRFFKDLSFLQGSLEKRRNFDDEFSFNQQFEVDVASSNYSLSEYEDSFVEVKPEVETKKEEIVVKTYDEDVCFTEMLVPLLKKLNDDQKHYAQVKILNVLRRARQFDPLSNIPESSGVVIVKNENS